jgi:hypothetical protein
MKALRRLEGKWVGECKVPNTKGNGESYKIRNLQFAKF